MGDWNDVNRGHGIGFKAHDITAPIEAVLPEVPGADSWPAVKRPAVSLTELNPTVEPVRIAEREPVDKCDRF